MNAYLCSAAVSMLIAITPAIAQTAVNPGTSDTTAPSASEPVNPSPSPPTNINGQSAVTGSSDTSVTAPPTPVEQNRLDPSAPSPQRLIIDPGSGANPSAPGNSYNAIQEGAANNGTSNGTSGIGVTPAPSALSPSMYPQRLTTPPVQNPASNYPAALRAPVFTQPNMTSGTGMGPSSARSARTAGRLQPHELAGSHAHSGGHH